MEENAPGIIEEGTTRLVAFAAEYSGAAVAVVAVAVMIGLGIWGFTALVRMFRMFSLGGNVNVNPGYCLDCGADTSAYGGPDQCAGCAYGM